MELTLIIVLMLGTLELIRIIFVLVQHWLVITILLMVELM